MNSEDEEKHEELQAGSLFEQRLNDYRNAINDGRHSDGQNILLELFASVTAKAAQEEPTQDQVWNTMAHECEEQFNWAGAEEAYRKCLALLKDDPVPARAVKPLLDLAWVYEIQGRVEEALVEIESALILAQQSEVPTLVVMAMEAKSRCVLGKGDLKGVQAIADEAMACLPDEKLYDLQRSNLLVLQARCAAGEGELETAKNSLVTARELLRPYGESAFMGGLQRANARFAEVEAIIHSAQGENEAAIEAAAVSVTHQRTIAAQPHLQGVRANLGLAKALRAYSQYLEAGGKSTEAAEARGESDRIFGGVLIRKGG